MQATIPGFDMTELLPPTKIISSVLEAANSVTYVNILKSLCREIKIMWI